MSVGAVQDPVSDDQIYAPELYRAAEKGSTCSDPKISVASTNVIMQILSERVIGPLSEIPNLDQQVEKGKIATGTTEKVERIFQAIGFTPSVIKGPCLGGEQKDLALRTANLFRFEYFDSWADILADYLARSRGFSENDAFRNILGALSGGSLSDAVGKRALEVFKESLAVQKQRLATAKGDLATAKGDLATQKTRLAAARDFIEARDRFMIRVLLRLGEEIESGKTR